MTSHLRRASVIGAGQIGGSIWRRLSEMGMYVSGWDPNSETRILARKMGLKCAESQDEATIGSEIIFLAGPLSALPGMLENIAFKADTHCIITDVGSTKSEVVSTADKLQCAQFIGGHPMAGTEGSGLAASNPSLFGGAAWVLTLEKEQQLPRFRKLADLLLTCFDVRIVPLRADNHDRIVALSSHLPHILAGGLANCIAGSPLKEPILNLAAGSFRDGTRVASTAPERTADMLWDNKVPLAEALDSFLEMLDKYRQASANRAELLDFFQRGFDLRAQFLTRSMQQARRRFDITSADSREELRFLSAVGADGGHIAECSLSSDAVEYIAWLP